MTKIKLQVILGSTREGRAADRLLPWLREELGKREMFEVEVLDLRDWPLPFFAETFQTVGDFANPTYSQPLVKRWNQKIAEGDAFLFITPEYNHSVPGILKNAVDTVFVSFAFRNKPAAFLGYSGGQVAGARAVEHLAQICFEAEMMPLRNSVLVPMVHEAFDASGKPVNPRLGLTLSLMLEDLAWWGTTLKAARATQLPPARVRMARAAKS